MNVEELLKEFEEQLKVCKDEIKAIAELENLEGSDTAAMMELMKREKGVDAYVNLRDGVERSIIQIQGVLTNTLKEKELKLIQQQIAEQKATREALASSVDVDQIKAWAEKFEDAFGQQIQPLRELVTLMALSSGNRQVKEMAEQIQINVSSTDVKGNVGNLAVEGNIK